MAFVDHASPDGAGNVTVEGLMLAGQPRLDIVVYAGVLRQLPWFRGGAQCAVLLGEGPDLGRIRIMRPGPYRLLQVGNRLDRLPPVRLRMPLLGGMRPGVHGPTPVTHRVDGTVLELVLPPGAQPARPMPPVYHHPLRRFEPASEGARA